jgi:hypothetical protein
VAGESSTDQMRTALVILAMPARPPTGSGGYTVDHPPGAPPAGAEAVRKWFSAKGFDVDPIVGIAFSISGPGSLFARTLGIDGAGAREVSQAALADRLDPDLVSYVMAVVVGPPPDFGLGDP